MPVIDLQGLFEGECGYRVDTGRIFLNRAAGRTLAYWVDDVDREVQSSTVDNVDGRMDSAIEQLPSESEALDLDLVALGRLLMAQAFLVGESQ